MQYQYPTATAAFDAAVSTPERVAALKHCNDNNMTYADTPDGTSIRVVSTPNFVLTLQYSPALHAWGFDWVWTDVARR